MSSPCFSVIKSISIITYTQATISITTLKIIEIYLLEKKINMIMAIILMVKVAYIIIERVLGVLLVNKATKAIVQKRARAIIAIIKTDSALQNELIVATIIDSKKVKVNRRIQLIGTFLAGFLKQTNTMMMTMVIPKLTKQNHIFLWSQDSMSLYARTIDQRRTVNKV